MNIHLRGPVSLAEVQRSLQRMEQMYRISTDSFVAAADPTLLMPEDEAARFQFLIAQRDALDFRARELGDWIPNYRHEEGTRLPEVDRETVECGVAA
jgi:hypothetical protein